MTAAATSARLRPLAEIEARIDVLQAIPGEADAAARELLALGEEILEHWAIGRGLPPTLDKKEGFRVLALHRQGAQGEPSFNACRETVRELVYYYNLVTGDPDHPETAKRLLLASMVLSHLYLFVAGKMQVAGLGEFCCSSRPLRAAGE
ncbi:MAG: hypothetical protein HY057_01150 [Rhodospirillales bacterium]|nr:hypothetical protein [Rhodospirillales bacterium]